MYQTCFWLLPTFSVMKSNIIILIYPNFNFNIKSPLLGTSFTLFPIYARLIESRFFFLNQENITERFTFDFSYTIRRTERDLISNRHELANKFLLLLDEAIDGSRIRGETYSGIFQLNIGRIISHAKTSHNSRYIHPLCRTLNPHPCLYPCALLWRL